MLRRTNGIWPRSKPCTSCCRCRRRHRRREHFRSRSPNSWRRRSHPKNKEERKSSDIEVYTGNDLTGQTDQAITFRPFEKIKATREFCVNQLCTVMHSTANKRIGRPGNSLIYRSLNSPFWTFNPMVVGSIPTQPTITYNYP